MLIQHSNKVDKIYFTNMQINSISTVFLVTFRCEKVIANSELSQPFGKKILSEFYFGRGYVYLSPGNW